MFHADLVLAKHDENDMPVEAAQSIESATRHRIERTRLTIVHNMRHQTGREDMVPELGPLRSILRS